MTYRLTHFENPYRDIRVSPLSGRYCVIYNRHADFDTLEAAQQWRDANPNHQLNKDHDK